jgi:hypothetical protein
MFGDNPNTPYGLMALGQGLSQLGAGQPVNMAPAMDAMMQRKERADMKRSMQESGVLNRFTPEQRAILASMPPSAAQQVIASVLFREPAQPDVKVVDGKLVDTTGRVVYEGQDEPEGWRDLTPEEVEARGLQPGRGWQIGVSGANTGRIMPAGGTPLVDMGADFTPGQEAVDKAYAQQYIDYLGGKGADASQQAAQILSVAEALESGAEYTGPMIGIQGDLVRAWTNPEAQDAKERVESVIQRSLRETLGAQFTEKEGERLIARAYNVNLPPEANASRLRALFATIKARVDAQRQMAEYFGEHKTLMGMEPIYVPTVDDMLAAMDSAAPSAGPATSGGMPDFSAMSDEELDAWIAANGG